MGLTNFQRRREARSTPQTCAVRFLSLAFQTGRILSSRFLMASVLVWSATVAAIVLLTGLVLLLFRYRKPARPQNREAATGREVQPEEAANSNSSAVTDDENKPEPPVGPGEEAVDGKGWDSSTDSGSDSESDSESDGVRRAPPGSSLPEPQRSVAHRTVHRGPPDLPSSRCHRDLPSNGGFPAAVHQISGFHGLFRLNLIYRGDGELRVHWNLALKTNTNGRKMEFPDLRAASGLRCFREPGKLLRVGFLQSSSDVLRSQSGFIRSSSCRFYLSLHRDPVTEPFRAPPVRSMLTAGRNSGNVAPSVPPAHTGDLPDAARLAEVLLSFDTDYRSFMSFLKWRQFYNARRRLPEGKGEFLCQS